MSGGLGSEHEDFGNCSLSAGELARSARRMPEPQPLLVDQLFDSIDKAHTMVGNVVDCIICSGSVRGFNSDNCYYGALSMSSAELQ